MAIFMIFYQMFYWKRREITPKRKLQLAQLQYFLADIIVLVS